ncbi:hypothetical protein D3C72_1498300 [compost metagenome]
MRGTKPSWIAWLVREKAPEMTACEAITVAQVASSTIGISRGSGTIRKNGFTAPAGLFISIAPWPK